MVFSQWNRCGLLCVDPVAVKGTSLLGSSDEPCRGSWETIWVRKHTYMSIPTLGLQVPSQKVFGVVQIPSEEVRLEP